jgi:hypothetical protein
VLINYSLDEVEALNIGVKIEFGLVNMHLISAYQKDQ